MLEYSQPWRLKSRSQNKKDVREEEEKKAPALGGIFPERTGAGSGGEKEIEQILVCSIYLDSLYSSGKQSNFSFASFGYRRVVPECPVL